MILSKKIAEQLQLLASGGQLPASSMKGEVVDELIEENIITVTIQGRTKRTYTITNVQPLHNWLHNRCSIPNLSIYLQTLSNANATRAEMAVAAADSKLHPSRAFTGFMVQAGTPLECQLNGQPLLLQPTDGLFHFITDFEAFTVPANVVIIGVENSANFRHASRQLHLFPDIVPLFVSRYPQEQYGDLLQWLKAIPNCYMHYGDLDLAGINIYMNEYKCHLGDRASFFIPANIEALLLQFGNPRLYNQQQMNCEVTEPALIRLVALLHQYKRCVEQEVLIA